MEAAHQTFSFNACVTKVGILVFAKKNKVRGRQRGKKDPAPIERLGRRIVITMSMHAHELHLAVEREELRRQPDWKKQPTNTIM